MHLGNAWVEGTCYRKPWFLPSSIEVSCRLSFRVLGNVTKRRWYKWNHGEEPICTMWRDSLVHSCVFTFGEPACQCKSLVQCFCVPSQWVLSAKAAIENETKNFVQYHTATTFNVQHPRKKHETRMTAAESRPLYMILFVYIFMYCICLCVYMCVWIHVYLHVYNIYIHTYNIYIIQYIKSN